MYLSVFGKHLERIGLLYWIEKIVRMKSRSGIDRFAVCSGGLCWWDFIRLLEKRYPEAFSCC